MSVATLTNIEKTFGKRVLFDKLSLTVYEGERIGFIGSNGSGKTTLFKMLTGEILPDAGSATISKSVKVGHLTQDPVFDPQNTVMDEAELAFAELHRLSHLMRDLEHAMGGLEADALEKVLDQYQNAQHEFELEGGYAWRHRLEATLLGVGLERETWEQTVATLSGGQRSRLALAKLLISEPDLLLLDEPTNHLDLAAIEWIEDYLLEFKGAVVLISHDRFLLDRLATRIIWLNQCQIDSFKGNYTAFVEQRELLELTQQRAHEEQQKDIEKQQEFIRRFQAGQRSKEARGRLSRLDRLLKSDEVIQKVATQHHIKLSLNTDQRAGDQVLNVRELAKSYGTNKLWGKLTLLVRRGERIGIVGPNGSGKTTLLRVLLGEEDADGGDVKWGANLAIGYYDQRLGDFDPDNSVYEEVQEGRAAKDKELRDVLAMMLFRGDDIYKPISALSGGERARVRLAQLLLDKPNVFVLDEPTNHLDIPSREALERALAQFTGTILCVSHDRYFLDRSVNRLLVLQPSGVVDFDGNYSAWMRKHHADTALATARTSRAAAAVKAQNAKAQTAKASPSRTGPKKDNPYLRPFGKLSVSELERQILATETALAECRDGLAGTVVLKDRRQMQAGQAQHEELERKLKELEAEYFARER
jgi:ATP-binding cassette subfamily F protein 3